MRELTVAKKSIGIDVGSHSVKAVVASKKGESLVVKNVVEVPIPRSGPAGPEQVAEAVEELGRRLKIGSELVVSSISTQQTTVRSLEIPFSEEEKARQILKFQTEPYLAFPIEEVLIDFYNTGTAPAGRMKPLLTAIHKGVVKNHLELLSKAKIDPEVVDVDFMAVASTVLQVEGSLGEGAATVLDVGASKTIACYIREGKLLAVRCIPLGGDDFTEAISKGLGVGFEEAERIKAGESAEGPAEDAPGRVRSAIGSVLERLGAELDRTLRSFSSQVRGGAFDRVILCGGSAYLKGLDAFLKEALSAEVSVLAPSGGIVNRSGQELPLARFATAMGLALRGVGESLCLQNFRVEEHAYARPLRRLRKRFAVAGALGVGIAGLLVFSLFASLDRYRGMRSELDFEIQKKRRTVFPNQRARDLAHMKEVLDEEKEKLLPFQELRRRFSVLEVLDDLSRRIPEDMKVEVSYFSYLKIRRRLTQSSRTRPERGARTRASAYGGRVSLRGTVSSDPDVVRLERILRESPYLEEVVNRGGTVRDPSGRTRFEFTLELKERSS